MKIDRRTVLKGTAAVAATSVMGMPSIVRAQSKKWMFAGSSPLTGPFAQAGTTALKDILGGESFAAFQNWGERRTARARQKARARKETRDLRRKLRTAAAAVVRARQQAAAEAREACQRVQRVALENIVEFFGLAPDAATPKNIYTKLCERGNTDRLNDIFPCIGMEVPPWYSLHPNDLRAKIMKHIGMNHQPDGEERNALWQTVSQAKIRRRRDEKEERRVKEQRRRTVIATTVRENVIDFLKVTDVNGDADDIPTLDAIADAFWRLDEPNRIECYVDKAGGSRKTPLAFDTQMKPRPKFGAFGAVARLLVHCGATEEKAKGVALEASKRVVTWRSAVASGVATTVRAAVIDFLKVTDVNGDADDIPTLDAIADAFWRLDEPNRIECYVDKAGLTGKTGLRYDKDMKPPKGKGLGSVANMLVHCGATEEKAKEVASEAYKRVVMAKIERKDRTQYR